MANYAEQAANGKRWCYDCGHFYRSYFCGYDECMCELYGSIDCGQKERHPDKTADTCKDYKPNGKEPWYKHISAHRQYF